MRRYLTPVFLQPGRRRVRGTHTILLVVAALLTISLFVTTPAPVHADAGAAGSVALRHVRTLDNDFAVTALAWHPDGRHLAVGQVLNRRVAIWDTQTGRLVRTLENESGGVSALAYSPDGQLLAVGREFTRRTKDGAQVHLYDARSGILQHSFVPPTVPVKGDSNDANALAFSPDGRYLVANGYGSGRTAVVYEVATRKPLHVLNDSEEPGFRVINAIAFSPDNRFVALGRVGGRVDVWSALNWDLVRRLEGLDASVHALAFSHTTKYLAVGTTIGDRWKPDGDKRKQIVGRFDDDVTVWEAPGFQKVFQSPARYSGTGIGIAIHYLRYSPDDNLLLVFSRGGTMQVVNMKTHKTVLFRDDFKKAPYTAISLDGKNIAIGLGNDIGLYQLVTYQ